MSEAFTAKSQRPIYFIFGHGVERIRDYDDRRTCPANITLVTFCSCGNFVYTREKPPEMIQAASQSNNYSILKSPLKNEDKIAELMVDSEFKTCAIGVGELKVRVYRPGDKIPNLRNTLGLNLKHRGGDEAIYKSGVVRFPIDSAGEYASLDEARSDNIYPIGGTSKSVSLYNILKKIQEIHTGKQVIVYYPACRDVVELHDSTQFIREIAVSTYQRVIAEPGTRYYDGFRGITDRKVQLLIKKILHYLYPEYKKELRFPMFDDDGFYPGKMETRAKSMIDNYLGKPSDVRKLLSEIKEIAARATAGSLVGDESKLAFFARAKGIENLGDFERIAVNIRDIRRRSNEQQSVRRSLSRKRKVLGRKRTVTSRNSVRDLSLDE
jgi:hypothetical protein